MRILVTLALALALLPALASADEFHGNECRRTEKQIAHFQNVLELAQARDNQLWEDATQQHIDRLQTRLEKRCPEHVKANIAARAAAEMQALMRAAAQAAITYFTGGLGGLAGL